MADPRVFQIAALGGLTAYGMSALDLELSVDRFLLVVGAALATEGLGRWLRGERFDPRSPLITAFSLSLLLRAASPWLATLAAVLAIGSKHLLRARGSHVFNPANFGIVVLLLVTDQAWVSAGQWGHAAILTLALAGVGQLVIHRAARSDVTWAFLAAWVALSFGRASWLGDPWAIPLHQLENGALLIFAFFMISDPRTTPRSRAGRLVYAAGVATAGFVLRFGFYEPNGLLFALFAAAPFVPLLDRWLPGPVFRWAPVLEEKFHASHPASAPGFLPLARGVR
ncbi:MAG: RnfABCDGE type electron transport complex subunit D [Deltaproteobacteria bacterium]|nr:RnfABCDGE type electron transport complex subunit D [Deltaproteobacteria bacterium]MBW2394537.1 RnfABCDGE type electron transport complex subunit D [Deltaproteobacteria bacterium]